MKRRALLGAFGAGVLLAGCGQQEDGGDGKAAKAPVSLEAIAAEAKGFNVGSTMSTRVVYVFFDPQCPHCGALWNAARPLKAQARFVWIPVGLLNDKSAAQGAVILNAADPVAAMDRHEASLASQQGGITAMGVTEAQKKVIEQNTALMNRFGFGAVPSIVGKHAQTGEVVTIEGSLPTTALAQRLGLQVPNS